MTSRLPDDDITWIACTNFMPDDDECVLIALDDGEVWTGYHDGDDGWRYVSADMVCSNTVTHWMPFPPPPSDDMTASAI